MSKINIGLNGASLRATSEKIRGGDVTESYYNQMLAVIVAAMAKGNNEATWRSPADSPVMIDAMETCVNLFTDVDGLRADMYLSAVDVMCDGKEEHNAEGEVHFVW